MNESDRYEVNQEVFNRFNWYLVVSGDIRKPVERIARAIGFITARRAGGGEPPRVRRTGLLCSLLRRFYSLYLIDEDVPLSNSQIKYQ